ncbi:MAG: hypothetical protein EZS28_013371 [Streblomastix strix]|uniref:Right handed beta helix domain-containing protein n=1 Tax=Streblomastix strix TaxID=222440 RepID=A0A5J4W8Z1_9EUKA|nr:MAG: hypothetical protein EZS28_013371 [Streblomastix strix]
MQIILLLVVSVALGKVFAPLANIAPLSKLFELTNDACSWKVSRSQEGEDIKNSVSDAILACMGEEETQITLLDTTYSETFENSRDKSFTIKGTTTGDMQTIWTPSSSNAQRTIYLIRGHMTLQNIDFPFILSGEPQTIAPKTKLINVDGGSSSKPSLTLIHCNFNGLGLDTESYSIEMISIGKSSTTIIDNCTFSDIFSKSVVISASSYDSISIKNSRFTDIKSDGSLSGAILIQAGNDDNYDIEITGNTFTNCSGNQLGTVGVIIFSDEDEGFLKFNGNTIQQCSGGYTGGFYVQYGSFGTIELNSNTFIGNDFTDEDGVKAADGFIIKRNNVGITDAVSYFKGLFAGSTSDKINSVYYQINGSGGAIDSSGYFTPDLPLPCLPTQTAAECACIDGDTRDVCKDPDVPISIIDCTKTPDNDACIGECKDNTKKTEAECACIVGDKREICKGKSAVGSLRVTLSLIVAAIVLPAIALY